MCASDVVDEAPFETDGGSVVVWVTRVFYRVDDGSFPLAGTVKDDTCVGVPKVMYVEL